VMLQESVVLKQALLKRSQTRLFGLATNAEVQHNLLSALRSECFSRVLMSAAPCKGIFLRDIKKTWVRAPPRKFHENANFSFPLFSSSRPS
jgi:hypothetical protein